MEQEYPHDDFPYQKITLLEYNQKAKGGKQQMAENNNNFKSTVEALFQGMDGVISSKTVVGDAIHVGDTIILPLVDVSFGIGAGSFRAEKREKGMGGIGGKITPSAVLVIKNGTTKLVNVRNQDTMTKILDMVPDLVDRFTEKKEDKVTEADVAEILDSAENEENV